MKRTSGTTDRLTRAAKDKIAELEATIQTVKQQDAQREPKMTREEKAQITAMQARIKDYQPQIDKLNALFVKCSKRNEELQNHAIGLMMASENPGLLMAEKAGIKEALVVISYNMQALQTAVFNMQSEIEQIKKAARDRELKEELEKNAPPEPKPVEKKRAPRPQVRDSGPKEVNNDKKN